MTTKYNKNKIYLHGFTNRKAQQEFELTLKAYFHQNILPYIKDCAEAKLPQEAKNLGVAINISDVKFIMNRSILTGSIYSEGMYALLYEFGSGSKMLDEDENPSLEDYKNSDYYNKARKDLDTNKIVGRKKGSYLGLDGKVHYSSGTLEGIVLEGSTIGGKKYEAIKPYRYIHDTIQENIDEIERRLLYFLLEFDYFQFFVFS